MSPRHSHSRTCPVCGRGYVKRRTVVFSTDRDPRDQYIHEQDGEYISDYCIAGIAGSEAGGRGSR